MDEAMGKSYSLSTRNILFISPRILWASLVLGLIADVSGPWPPTSQSFFRVHSQVQDLLVGVACPATQCLLDQQQLFRLTPYPNFAFFGYVLVLTLPLDSAIVKSHQYQTEIFRNAGNQTRGLWVRSKNTTSGLCSSSLPEKSLCQFPKMSFQFQGRKFKLKLDYAAGGGDRKELRLERGSLTERIEFRLRGPQPHHLSLSLSHTHTRTRTHTDLLSLFRNAIRMSVGVRIYGM